MMPADQEYLDAVDAAPPGHVALCVEGVRRGKTVGPETDCPPWAPYAVLQHARDAGVQVDVEWDPETRTMTVRPPETPEERAERVEGRRRAGLCQRSRWCARPLAPGHAELCAAHLAVERGIFGRDR